MLFAVGGDPRAPRLTLILLFGLTAAFPFADASGKDPADWRPSERWRGFNLLSMFIKDNRPDPPVGTIATGFGYANAPEFSEDDFRIIRSWDFNFVRLPLDYRYWVKGFDPLSVDEDVLGHLDRAIELGRRYGIHVQLCLHRVPGYRSGLSPAEAGGDLLREERLQDRTCAIWANLARRYRDVPNERVSFNLLNEPPDDSPDGRFYAAVAKKMIAAIRCEDPKRFIISDGLRGGNHPCKALFGIPGVGQAARGYVPRGFVTNGTKWPVSVDSPQGVFANKAKSGWYAPFSIVDLPACAIELTFGRVSGPVTLVAKADGIVVGRITLDPTDKTCDPKWVRALLMKRWNIWQGEYCGVERLTVPVAAKRFTLEVERGDWICVSSMTFVSPDGVHRSELVFSGEFGKPSGFDQRFCGWEGKCFAAIGHETAECRYPDSPGKEYLYRQFFKPWEEAEKAGVFVMIGEFGAVHRNIPHDVAMRWMNDLMDVWQDLGWGWAVWGLFRDKYGIMDNDRKDIELEDFHGHKLDRKMLELMRRH